jgi:hypothetical protein
MNCGMNAALAVDGNYAYVGSRTNGKDNIAAVMIVHIADPAHRRSPARWVSRSKAARESSRELRVWHSRDVLIVLQPRRATARLYAQPSSNNFRSTTCPVRGPPFSALFEDKSLQGEVPKPVCRCQLPSQTAVVLKLLGRAMTAIDVVLRAVMPVGGRDGGTHLVSTGPLLVRRTRAPRSGRAA